MKKYFTGIGSRKTPGWSLELPLTYVCAEMRRISWELTSKGYTLRSGGADGADLSFELGAGPHKEIWVPWRGFNIQSAKLLGVDLPREEWLPLPEALDIAKSVMTASHWGNCSDAAKKLHARNVHQVLGKDLKTPSSVVYYWTDGGGEKGGTSTALKVAKMFKVPTILVRDD